MSWWAELCAPCGEGQRPGGLALTAHAAALCGFTARSRLLDVACGGGETLRSLRSSPGCEVVGLEQDASLCGGDVLQGRAEELPFEADSFDGVLIECALSQFDDADAALSECARVLRPGGRLAVADLYARDGADHPDSPMGRVEGRDTLAERFARHGFAEALFEDHSDALISLWATARLSGGESAVLSGLWQSVRAEGLKPGYGLWIERKE